MTLSCPQAVDGLLTSDHAKRGRRFVSVLEPSTMRVTLLEPWEHAVLILCDGAHNANAIAERLREGVAGEPVTKKDVTRCLKFFERDGLIEQAGFREAGPEPAAGPRTLAQMQQAFHEWHRDPVRTGQILAGTGPFVDPTVSELPVGLSPTVALPDEEDKADSKKKQRTPVAVGTTLVLGSDTSSFGGSAADELHSVLEAKEDLQPAKEADELTEVGELSDSAAKAEAIAVDDVAELLRAVDDDLKHIEEVERQAPSTPPPVGKAQGGEVEMDFDSPFPPAHVLNEKTQEASPDRLETYEMAAPDRDELLQEAGRAELLLPRLETQRAPPPNMAQLTPTMVGIPAEGQDGPLIISPPRNDSDIAALNEDTARLNEAEISQSDFREVPDVVETTNAEATSRTVAPFDQRTRRVFETLWRAGIAARADAEHDDHDPEGRRGNPVSSQRFDEGLNCLNEGELEFAMVHFAALAEHLPQSDRIAAFASAIRDVLGDEPSAEDSPDRPSWQGLYTVAETAMAAGRCPQCLSVQQTGETACMACGFALTESDSVITSEGVARSVVD